MISAIGELIIQLLSFSSQDNVGFSNPVESVVKTFVMMIGELEYTSIFHENKEMLYFPWLSYTLFMVFVIVMSIIIMNLLVCVCSRQMHNKKLNLKIQFDVQF